MQKINKIILLLILVVLPLTYAAGDFAYNRLCNLNIPVEENGGVPVNIQDQTTRPFSVRVNQIIDNSSYSLVAAPVVDQYVLELNTTVGLNIGDSLSFLEQNGMAQIFFSEIDSINGNNVTMNSLVPYNFTPSNTFVFTFSDSLVVDGSINHQVFEICNVFDEEVDITRFIFNCRSTSSMDDSTFCGEPELDRGFLVRKKKVNGNFINYFKVNTNGQWIDLAFDGRSSDRAPAGEFGFGTRLTYAGPSKHGVVIRLEMGECIQGVNQDDLTGLTYAILMVEGHFVQN